MKGLFNVMRHKYRMAKDPICYLRSQGAKIGSGCSIASNVSFGSEPYLITIGNDVRLTEHVRLITHDGGLWVVRRMFEQYKDADLFGRIQIGNNVHVGVNSIIMPGVTVGNNVIIGCGAVVTHDIPDNSVAAGVPARVIETVEEYIEKNRVQFVNTKILSAIDKQDYLLQIKLGE